MSRFLQSILLCACLMPLVFSAKARADVSRPLVVDMTTLTKTPRTGPIQEYIQENTPFTPDSYPLISGSNPQFTEDFRWVYPADERLVCPAKLEEVEAQLDNARRLIVELELDQAIADLRATFETLPCQTESITREEFRKIFYYEGIAYHYTGQAGARGRAFLEALSVAPEGEPLPGFPPDITEAYEAMRRQLEQRKPVRVSVDQSLVTSGAMVDGDPLPAGGSIDLFPGRHLIQLANVNKVMRTATFLLSAKESRPLNALIKLMPPGSAAYLNALLRSSVLGTSLTPAQKQALEAYVKLHNHSMLIFVLVSNTSLGELRIRTYIPGTGLIEGVPDGLTPLPPMSSAVASAQSGDTGAGRPGRKHDRRKDQEVSESSMAMLLSLGPVGYDGAVFSSVHLSGSFSLFKGLSLNTGLYYANDIGMNYDDARNLIGLRLGPEYGLDVGPLLTRAGVGAGLAAARLTTVDGSNDLVLELTPEAWLGLEYPLSESLSVGIEGGGGFTPVLVGPGSSRAIWRAGLVMGWRL